MLLNNLVIGLAVILQSFAVHPAMFIIGRFICGINSGTYIGVGTMGAPGAGSPPMFSDSYIARLNFIHADHTALAYRSVEPPFTKPSSYASDIHKI